MKTGVWSDITATETGQGYLAKGEKGDQGIQGVQGERGQMGIQGVQGQQGIQGATGPTGPKGADGVCPSCPPTSGGVFPFNIVIDNGTDNKASTQAAIDDSYVTGKPIWLIGNNFKMSSGTLIPVDIKQLEINGAGIIVATNSNVWTLFSSRLPVNKQEAEDKYTNRRLTFRNLTFNGMGQKQTMFDLQCTEGAVYDNIEGKDLALIIDNSFGLRSIISNPESVNCIESWRIKSAAGKYPDATIENSAPNGTTITDARIYGGANTLTSLLIADCSGCKVDGLVVEGARHNIGVELDYTSPTSTPVEINRVHFEAAQPCGVALFRVKSSTLLHTFNQLNLVKPSIFFEIIPLGTGNPKITIENTSNQRIVYSGTPIFKTANRVMWEFVNCDVPLTVNQNIPQIFTGSTMQRTCERENLNANSSGYCIVRSPKLQ